jgi:leader peptidase (prepilin peptidase)/N-methyltransferase
MDGTPILAGLFGVVVGAPAISGAMRVGPVGRFRVPSRRELVAELKRPVTWPAILGCGFAAAIAGSTMRPTAGSFAFWIFGPMSVALGVVDIRVQRLPHQLTAGLALTCALLLLTQACLDHDQRRALVAISAAIAASGMFLTIAVAAPGQLGLGDVGYAGVVALTLGWLGWPVAASGLMIALAGGGVTVAMMAVVHRSAAAVPLGPAMAAGWLIALELHAMAV